MLEVRIMKIEIVKKKARGCKIQTIKIDDNSVEKCYNLLVSAINKLDFMNKFADKFDLYGIEKSITNILKEVDSETHE